MRKILVLIAIFLVCMSFGSAYAETDFDFLTFAKEKVLTDYHPTAKPENATAEYKVEPAAKDAGVISATVTVFYSGWVRKHQADYEIDVMPAEGLVKVNVLEDTNGMNKLSNKIFKPNSWVELASLGVTIETTEAPAKVEAPKDFDFLGFATKQVLPDFHPTAKPEEATAEYDKGPDVNDNGTVSARVRIRYTSLKTKQDMLALIEVRPGAGLVKVTIVRDSDVLNLTGNKIFRENTWVELSSLDWE